MIAKGGGGALGCRRRADGPCSRGGGTAARVTPPPALLLLRCCCFRPLLHTTPPARLISLPARRRRHVAAVTGHGLSWNCLHPLMIRALRRVAPARVPRGLVPCGCQGGRGQYACGWTCAPASRPVASGSGTTRRWSEQGATKHECSVWARSDFAPPLEGQGWNALSGPCRGIPRLGAPVPHAPQRAVSALLPGPGPVAGRASY